MRYFMVFIFGAALAANLVIVRDRRLLKDLEKQALSGIANVRDHCIEEIKILQASRAQ